MFMLDFGLCLRQSLHLLFFSMEMNIYTLLRSWRRGVVVITTAQLYSTRFCAGSNPARGVSEIRDGEDL